MANRSVFPDQLDTFIEHFDIQASNVADVKRFQELKLKSTLTPSEQTELSSLTTKLRDKVFTPEDFNKLQDAITNLEGFFRDNVQGYISTKQTEMNTYVTGKKAEVDTAVTNGVNTINTTVASATSALNVTRDNGVTTMEDKKNYFVNYVNTKEAEVQAMVRDFDSNTARYYQTWKANDGQLEFNIFATQGSNKSIPVDANLNIAEENIDLIVNGSSMTPYTDFVIKNNGFFDTIVITGANAGLISAGTEVSAKWFKNVGKLYFSHASTHMAGGDDPLTVYENMLDPALSSKVNNVRQKFTVGKVAPTTPAANDVWIDTN
ncbi:hypothetical protein [Paenibacillus sp. MMO-177]|uniref:hypothetical protein n=1 Tax=Paenibacillus sp. MMO-177 TaxID=3081289 RepID=UPI003018AB97